MLQTADSVLVTEARDGRAGARRLAGSGVLAVPTGHDEGQLSRTGNRIAGRYAGSRGLSVWYRACVAGLYGTAGRGYGTGVRGPAAAAETGGLHGFPAVLTSFIGRDGAV